MKIPICLSDSKEDKRVQVSLVPSANATSNKLVQGVQGFSIAKVGLMNC